MQLSSFSSVSSLGFFAVLLSMLTISETSAAKRGGPDTTPLAHKFSGHHLKQHNIGISHGHGNAHARGVHNDTSEHPAKTKRLLNMSIGGVQLPYDKWDFMDKSAKVYGVNLGNLFLLERWMDEDWFTSHAGTDVYDMWNWMKKLGPVESAAALTAHYTDFIAELDLASLIAAGANHVRIPMGYWSWIDIKGNEPFQNNGEVAKLSELLTALYAHGMYATIDLHGMPGSQSTDAACGHAASSPQWFTQENQDRSDQMLENVINFIRTSPVGAVVSSVLVVNEPCGPVGCHNEHRQILRDYYERSYKKLKAASIPMFFHSGFVPGGLHAWTDFVQGKDPKYLIGTDNPYPAAFPPKSNQTQIFKLLCDMVQSYTTLPFPVVLGEWSLGSANHDPSFQYAFYANQAGGYARSAGSTFWSYVVKPTHVKGGIGQSKAGALQWSWKDANAKGIVPSPKNGEKILSFFNTLLDQQC